MARAEEDPKNLLGELGFVLMAAGLSKRSGFQKLLRTWEGKPLYRHIFDLLVDLPFGAGVIVSNLPDIRQATEETRFSWIPNPEAASGKASTIRRGTDTLLRMTEREGKTLRGIFYFVADQPYISAQTCLEMAALFRTYPGHIVYPCSSESGKKKRANPMLFPRLACDRLLCLQGDEGGVRLLDEGFPSLALEIDRPEEGRDFDHAEDFEKD